MSHPFLTYLPLRERLRVVHHVPGRIRLRFSRPPSGTPGNRLDTAGLDQFLTAVRGGPAIRAVRLSPATLSAIIEYDPSHLPTSVWSTLLAGPEEAALAAFDRMTGAAQPA